jgi:predicted small integral membrane protein
MHSALPPAYPELAGRCVARALGLLSLRHSKVVDIAEVDGEILAPAIMRMTITTTTGDRFFVDLDMSRMIELALAKCGIAH